MSLTVNLRISREEYLKHYQGVGQSVLAMAEDGRRVRFPARVLQPYVSHQGISGRFRIYFDCDRRFTGIESLD